MMVVPLATMTFHLSLTPVEGLFKVKLYINGCQFYNICLGMLHMCSLTNFAIIFSIMFVLYMRLRWSSNMPFTHRHGLSASYGTK
jgi:hypothetical protein